MKQGDKIKVHLYSGGREIHTDHFGEVFTVRMQAGEMGIDWNTSRSPYTGRGEVFAPFSTFAPSVTFENVETGEKCYFSNLARQLVPCD